MINNICCFDFEKADYDIIIEAGQSNAQGCGKGPVTEEYEADGDIRYLVRDFDVSEGIKDGKWRIQLNYKDTPLRIEVADERCGIDGKVGDFALTFARAYKESYLADGRKLMIIRAGVGGTGFKKKQWTPDGAVYLKMLEMIDFATALNENNRLVAFLWHQGEHDAFEGNHPDVFEDQLRFMINSVKERYNAPAIPFVSGDFVNEWKSENIESCAPIIERIRKITAEQGGMFVETSDLSSNNQVIANGDNIHFSRESLHILGKRYFDAFCEIMRNSRA
jgi:hypothetical protein